MYHNGIKLTILNTVVDLGRSEDNDDEVTTCPFSVVIRGSAFQSLVLGQSASLPLVLGIGRA